MARKATTEVGHSSVVDTNGGGRGPKTEQLLI